MTYTLDTSHTSPNQTAAANCSAAFGYPRNIIGTTIHHWDAKGSGANWDGTLATLLNDYRNPGSRGVSAHFMAETGRVACLVFPGDAAWHAGNPQGNAQTIGIELNPDESTGTYQTAAELIAQIWVDWGIPHKLYHHYDWTSTGCPGTYDLVRLRRVAEVEYSKLTKGGTSPQSTTVTPLKGALMALTDAQQTQLFNNINLLVARTAPIHRGDIDIAMTQEIADGKTVAINNNTAIKNVAAAVAALAAAPATAVTLTDAQVQQIIAALPAATLAAFKEQINK